MKISKLGLELIEYFEGCELKAYQDTGNVWTIGIGSTIVDGKPVKKGMTCTRQQAYEYLVEHLNKHVTPYIEKFVDVPLNQNQFDAISSFIYNLGAGSFQKSTLLKKLNAGDYNGAADEFLKWVKDNGKTLDGLVKRRTAERKLFLAPVAS